MSNFIMPKPVLANSNPKTIDDKYKVLEFLGSGSFGEVYSALDSDGNQVAIKIEREAIEVDLSKVAREYNILRNIDHPHIVKVLNFGFHKRRPYLVMEMFYGRTLEQILENGKVDNQLLQKFIDEFCDAVSFLHSKQIIHRDLKPQNVMLTETEEGFEKFVVLDFGLAVELGKESCETNKRFIGAGTPNYMAPEQIARKKPTRKMDIYATGALLYQVVTGCMPIAFSKKPGDSINFEEVFESILTQVPLLPSKANRNAFISKDIDELLMQCLAKNPDYRPSSINRVRYRFLKGIDSESRAHKTIKEIAKVEKMKECSACQNKSHESKRFEVFGLSICLLLILALSNFLLIRAYTDPHVPNLVKKVQEPKQVHPAQSEQPVSDSDLNQVRITASFPAAISKR